MFQEHLKHGHGLPFLAVRHCTETWEDRSDIAGESDESVLNPCPGILVHGREARPVADMGDRVSHIPPPAVVVPPPASSVV